MSDTTVRPPLASLLEDQRRRWQAGERVPVEDYLAAHPGLADDAVLDLIFQEVVLRERRGECPQAEEYARRFPRLAETLRMQFSVDRAMWGSTLLSGDGAASASSREPDAALPGELPQIDGYDILGLLGRGGMGVVYKAWHQPLKRLVALKMIHGPAQAGPEGLARFRTEAEAIARLQHPNIVQVHEVGEQGGCPYLALEFVAGGSLATRLDGTPWPARPAAELARTLALAVQHAHERGVIHRDLKPANILIADSGLRVADLPEGAAPPDKAATVNPTSETPKIADFGLARLVLGGGGTLTHSGQILGTPSYMPPEQARGQARQVGPARDIYALGAILYELLTGRPPFKAATIEETLVQVLTEDPVPPSRLRPKVPRDLETICLHCLHKEPAKRYATAAELAEDLRRFLADEPVRARPLGLVGRLVRWSLRNPAVAGLLLAVFALLVGGTGVSTALWLEARARAREARAERDHAEENFRLTLRTVEEYLTRVGDSEELKAHGLEKLRQSLLETANGFYRRFVEQRGDDPRLQDELGRAYGRLAYIGSELGEFEQAAELNQRMRDVFAALATAHPDDPHYRQQFALGTYNLANQYRRLGRWDDAEMAALEAVRLREQLGRDLSGADDALSDLAESQTLLAALYRQRGRWDDAEARHREARRLREELLGRHPDSARYQAELATTWGNLGVLYHQTRRQQDAAGAYTEALALRERLHREHPNTASYGAGLAETLSNLGGLRKGAGRLPDARADFEAAHDLLTGLIRAHPYVVRFRSSCAACAVNLADLYLATREWDKAEKAAAEARTLFGDLGRELPDLPEYAFGLSQALTNLFAAFHRSNRPREAEAACVEASRVLEKLCRVYRQVPEYQKALAGCRLNLGALHYDSGRHAEAETAWRGAAEAAAALCGDHPQIPGYQSLLADCFNNVGAVCRAQGKPAEAGSAYKKALELQEKLWHDHRGTPGYAVRLADACANLADLDLGHGRPENALGWCDRAVPPLEEVLRKAEGYSPARKSLGNVLRNRAAARRDLGRYAEAVKDWDQIVLLADADQRDTWRVSRAVALARAGEHARAAAEAEELARAKQADGAACYDLACAFALASLAAGADTALPAGEHGPSAERLAVRAVELLTQAGAAGYFRTAASRENMRKDSDLDSLRPRPDFKSWLAGLEKNANKEGK